MYNMNTIMYYDYILILFGNSTNMFVLFFTYFLVGLISEMLSGVRNIFNIMISNTVQTCYWESFVNISSISVCLFMSFVSS